MSFLPDTTNVHEGYSTPDLIEMALKGEATLCEHGQLLVDTGKFTGRAAEDKYVVNEGLVDVTFGPAGKPMSVGKMNLLTLSVNSYLQGRDVYVAYFKAANKKIKLITEFAWHCVFVRNLFTEISPCDDADLTIIDLPGCKAIPEIHQTRSETFIACDFPNGIVLICGTKYAGEIKKSVFSYIAYISPEEGNLPMHASAVTNMEGGNAAVFFGLSGTGKTSLSSFDGARLLGDDEIIWSDAGLSNIESGCYAKVINLSEEKEPLIWCATNRFRTVLENVHLDDAHHLDFSNSSVTENTRAAYPLSYIKDSHAPGTVVEHPKNIIMLTCDAFGVLPAVSKLDVESALYHFKLGYTAKVAGTELGLTAPKAAFSPCFGAPFMLKDVNVYAGLLEKRLNEHKPNVWLVNTGWMGGGVNVGSRMSISETRNIVNQIISGKLAHERCAFNQQLKLNVPVRTFNCEPKVAWYSKSEYDEAAKNLMNLFDKNAK
jgi:phosphoenolpyruvate carboxykinase (ATP)